MTIAPKNKESKPDISLLPLDQLNDLLIPAYTEGLQEYYRDSWRLGFPISDSYSAAMRHLIKFMFKGEDIDIETLDKYGIKKSHLGAAIFHLICIYNTLKVRPDLDDRIKINEGRRRNKR